MPPAGRASSPGPSRGAVLVLAVLAMGSSCEPAVRPVREELRLGFLSDGAVLVESVVTVERLESADHPSLERRLAEVRQALAEGWDPWTARFETLGAPAERYLLEKAAGEVHRATRSAVVREPGTLVRFFGDTSLQVGYAVDAERGRAELTILPGPPARATRRQQRQVEASLGRWAEAVAAYLEAAVAVYAWAEDYPERGRAVFGELFGPWLPEEEERTLPDLTAEEAVLLDRLGDAMLEVWRVVVVPEDGDRSLDELSRLVYDPFPAPLTVRLPAEPEEVEGFAVRPDGSLFVPGLGLWDTLPLLAGRWLDPDPLLLCFEHEYGAPGSSFDLVGFLRAPRSAVPASALPTARQLREAIAAGLSAAPLYRAVWAIDPETEPSRPWGED